MNQETHSLPIGIFDSGLGGLTIVKAVQALLPNEQVIYFGDTAHLPYGDKSPALIQTYAAAISQMLIRQGVKAIVIACNTASAVAFWQVQEIAGEVPVFNVIIPAVNEALKATISGRVGIIGTKTTIRTSIYRKLLLAKSSKKLKIIEKATPLLVPMIEEGWLHNQVSQDVIDAYMSDTGFQHIDTLILGCTHYPLVKSQIDQYFKENYAHAIQLIDSSEAVATAVKEALTDTELLSVALEAEHKYYLSDMSPNFEASAELFLGKSVSFNSCKLTA